MRIPDSLVSKSKASANFTSQKHLMSLQKQVDEGNKSLQELANESAIVKSISLLLERAVKLGASDIHIEPRDNHVVIRYRVDGLLREANKLPKKVLTALVSGVKILAHLDIDESSTSQEGQFKTRIDDRPYSFRASTLPVSDGEKVVIHILNEFSQAQTLEELGYWGYSLEHISKAIAEPNGLILVCGPNNSGKSTSLFSLLNILSKPTLSISTIEDPVDYKIPHANQTQVNSRAGITFASGLKALLRQDSNVIMVGEIRDKETADLSIQAVLSGHLVLATLYTKNAATCLSHLVDMGVEPFLVANTIQSIVGQRLIKKLCLGCRQDTPPSPTLIKNLDKIFGTNKPEVMKRLHSLEVQAINEDIGRTGGSTLSTTDKKIIRVWKADDDGCEDCGHSGYKGRLGIYEVLYNSPNIQKLLVSSAPTASLQTQAVKAGMLTMPVDALIKSFCGLTSIDEVLSIASTK